LPNKVRNTIFLKDILDSDDYRNTSCALPIILGVNIAGNPVVIDLAKCPHLLIAGTTGSGKSVAINTMILSLLYKFTPDECKFIMIDPKILELSIYQGIPHLLTPVVSDSKKAVVSLKWVVGEMENRYRIMSNLGVRNIYGYNEKIREAIQNKTPLKGNVITGYNDKGEVVYDSVDVDLKIMPFIVVVVDEMADLMLTAGKDVEALIQRIAQMARAAGIHIIMSTQRPSTDVITGVIKANFPSRISFLVSSKIDSRVIIGEQGAEQLLGFGDMLYSANGGKITRAHGPFVSDKEVQMVIDSILKQGIKPVYVASIQEESGDGDNGGGNIDISIMGGNDEEDVYKQAVEIIRRDKKVSISYIQRQLRIGYNKAAGLIERMEKEGIVTAAGIGNKRDLVE
jgi:S-DNA-T family DNA segregation ATPase FtsK/SpoIIIE